MYSTAVLLVPLLAHFASGEGTTGTTPTPAEEGPIGQTFNVPKMDLLSTTLAADGVRISKPFAETCKKSHTMTTSKRDEAYYSNTRDVYSALETDTKVDASLTGTYTMKASLDAVTNSISASSEKVTGYTLRIFDYSLRKSISKGCLNNIKFNKAFLNDLDNLPKEISNPKHSSSWVHYNDFIRKYGTHMVNAIVYGASLYTYSFAKSSHHYSQKDFKVKACVGLQGQTQGGEVKIDACVGVTSEDRENVTSLEMNDKVVVRGGTRATRVQLLHKRDEELVEQFLTEGKTTPSPVEYNFIAIWDLVKNSFDLGTDRYAKAKNLEEYFKGYLVYGCGLKKLDGIEVQKFELAPQSNPDNPAYQCMVMQPGCNRNGDCHYRIVPASCSCNGPSCVENKMEEQVDGRNKRIAYAYNEGKRGTAHGCSYQYIPAECHCDSRPNFSPAWQNGGSKRSAIPDHDDHDDHDDENQEEGEPAEDKGEGEQGNDEE